MKIITTVFLFFAITFISYGQQDSRSLNSKQKTQVDTTARYQFYELETNTLQNFLLSFHLGFLGSSEYGDILKAYYSSNNYDVSGFTAKGFIDFGLKMEFKIYKNLYIYSGMTVDFSSIPKKVTYTYLNNYTEDKTTGTFVLVPEFGSTYYYKLKQNLFYASMQFGYPFISDPEDDLDFSGDGVSIHYSIGYRREFSDDKSIGIEMGYFSVPVKVNSGSGTQYYSSYSHSEYNIHSSKNFGGFLIKLVYAFTLGG